ncbi:carbohydrate ABC transporter permease [Paenibacillaceae bacterium WGS1546]|uniref:carbohydrate ABC transporter permease n=1 Tax=Cohnella sp. WGS1546 TaxID=3366810 RepID=UPI00372D1C5C
MKSMKRIADRPYTYALVLPGFLLYGAFFLVPSLFGGVLSFANVGGFSFEAIRFAGWTNYVNVLTDEYLSIAIRNSFIFAFATTVLKVGIGMALAVFLNQQLRTRNYLRTVFFLPAVLSTVAVGVFFTSAMHPTTGMINTFLESIGLHELAQDWLTNPHLAIYSLVFIETWKWAGFTMAILLAGLQSISKDYYESADIEGATAFQKFKSITFPLVLPYFNNALIVNLIGGLKVFDLVQAVTQGGPGAATEVFGTLVFKSFGSGRLGEGAAASILLSLIVIAIALPTWKLINRKEVEL